MKKLIILFFAIASMAMMQSCHSTSVSGAVMGIKNAEVFTQAVADINYEGATKVYGYCESKVVLGIFHSGANRKNSVRLSNNYGHLSHTERGAIYDALEKSEADIILEPQFKTIHKIGFLGLSCTTQTYMTGWAAKITGFHAAPDPVVTIKKK